MVEDLALVTRQSADQTRLAPKCRPEDGHARAPAFGQIGFPGHRGVDLLHHEGFGRPLGEKVDDLDVGLTEADLPEQDVDVELRDRCGGRMPPIFPEIGDGLDVLVGEDAVAACEPSSVSTHTRASSSGSLDAPRFRSRSPEHRSGRRTGPRVQARIVFDVDEVDLHALFGEEAFPAATKNGPLPTQIEIADSQRLGMGRGRRGLR